MGAFGEEERLASLVEKSNLNRYIDVRQLKEQNNEIVYFIQILLITNYTTEYKIHYKISP